jgi:hypothetical protein
VAGFGWSLPSKSSSLTWPFGFLGCCCLQNVPPYLLIAWKLFFYLVGDRLLGLCTKVSSGLKIFCCFPRSIVSKRKWTVDANATRAHVIITGGFVGVQHLYPALRLNTVFTLRTDRMQAWWLVGICLWNAHVTSNFMCCFWLPASSLPWMQQIYVTLNL